LANREVHDALLHYAQLGYTQHGVAIGRYVIMPDHVHLFVVLPETGVRLTLWVRGLKRAMGDALASRQEVPPYWQEGFFDHVLRHGESHSEKWHYVRENPVRRGLATRADDWPWQGELVPLRY
jgi:putative transposase